MLWWDHCIRREFGIQNYGFHFEKKENWLWKHIYSKMKEKNQMKKNHTKRQKGSKLKRNSRPMYYRYIKWINQYQSIAKLLEKASEPGRRRIQSDEAAAGLRVYSSAWGTLLRRNGQLRLYRRQLPSALGGTAGCYWKALKEKKASANTANMINPATQLSKSDWQWRWI